MRPRCTHDNREGFTLIELLVVIAIITLLVSILMPSLSKAKDLAKAAGCRMNLKNLGLALTMYQAENNELVVPSYNMTGTDGGANVPLDGWGPILDRDKFVNGNRENSGSLFACPSMLDIEGMKAGQTGTDPRNACGWMDWPNTRLGNANVAVTIPQWGFDRIIRVGYWINADNPIGGVTSVTPDLFYTSSVGYGPGSNGVYMRNTSASVFQRPSNLIAMADGVYAGRQRDNRMGTTNCRIGYRHGGSSVSNVAMADGHVDSIRGEKFPRATGGSNNVDEVWTENTTGPYTVYADPWKSIAH